MKKEFVLYEQALALKELGFDEPCITFYPVDLTIPLTVLINCRFNAIYFVLERVN